ncbi:MAG: sulfite exporter TauE/SafE family protein [Labedaea sp.]
MGWTLLIAGLALTVGGFVQGSVGFGLALVSVPVLALVRPDLVPGPMVLVGTVHTVLSVLREHTHVDWRGVRWATLGLLPGTVLGAVLVAALPQRGFALVVGAGVLAFTVLSAVSPELRPTPPALTSAGFLSGTFGTAMAIGGPPVALLYQREHAAKVRSTLSAFFLLGAAPSVLALLLTGQLDGHDVRSAVTLAPFLVAGFALSGPARRLVSGGRLRYAVLGFAGISAVALILRSLFG